jgi:hypothetical protein
VHKDLKGVARVRAVADFVRDAVSNARRLFSPEVDRT